jgi:beta-glucosidase
MQSLQMDSNSSCCSHGRAFWKLTLCSLTGLQRSDRFSELALHQLALSKHAPAITPDRTPAIIPNPVSRDDFLPPFAAAIKAGVHAVMVNSSEVNGIPGHIHRNLLTTVLRDEFRFKGVVVSDWEDIKKLVTIHRAAATEKDATLMAIMAGIDVSMVPRDYSFGDLLMEVVQQGRVPVSRIDQAVSRVLTLKYELGLFADPMLGSASGAAPGSTEAQQKSLQAARESIILLKNDHVLPLTKSSKVLVTGPSADSLQSLNNGWSYTWQGARADLYPKNQPTILAAIKAMLPPDNVVYVPGSEYDKELDIPRALAAAKDADVAVVCLGEMAYAETPGNIDDPELPDAQINLAQQITAMGKPVVLLLV